MVNKPSGRLKYEYNHLLNALSQMFLTHIRNSCKTTEPWKFVGELRSPQARHCLGASTIRHMNLARAAEQAFGKREGFKPEVYRDLDGGQNHHRP